MPSTPDSAPRRSKAKMTEEALASRVASHLDRKAVEAAPEPEIAEKRVVAEPELSPSAPSVALPKAKAATVPAEAALAAPATLFGAGMDRLTGAARSAQELTRDTVRSLADTRLQTAQSLVDFQKKLLEMVQANLSESLAVAQKIMSAPNVGEAIKVQSSFATGRVKALADQAAELRSLTAKLAKESQEPWAAHFAKSLDRVKGSLNA